jgi:hypothetical protein
VWAFTSDCDCGFWDEIMTVMNKVRLPLDIGWDFHNNEEMTDVVLDFIHSGRQWESFIRLKCSRLSYWPLKF